MGDASTPTVEYPGTLPGRSRVSLSERQLCLENAAIRCTWELDADRVSSLAVEHPQTGQAMSLSVDVLPCISFTDGRTLSLSRMIPTQGFCAADHGVHACFRDVASGLELTWSVSLADDANSVVQSLQVKATQDVEISSVVFLDGVLADVRQVGEVDGSVVVCGDLFMGVEHPLAKNRVVEPGRVRCGLTLNANVVAGETRAYTFAIGATPPGQLRRGFLYYIEQRRIHPYRQFLHYNNWYDVWLGREPHRMTEEECLEAIEYFGQELVEKRDVAFDAFVWDDGWDDFGTLWGFHEGFPDGFKNLMAAARAYGADQGVWMSPNGGYATAKAKRLAYGREQGYEANENGFAMGGPRYRQAFHAVCLDMIREQGVTFFKFDGMGEGGTGTHTLDGASGALSKDIDSVLELSRELHAEKPDVYVSATVGTWASPYWLLFVDSVWRQGADTGFHGEGNTRQQWITYRDMFCYERAVQAGPLYPLNALMLHGLVIGDRPGRAPAGIALDEKSVIDEIWSFFGSGTCLQELYVSPHLPSGTMVDQLAAAARWARSNSDVLIDTHWVGGNPGTGDVYGWAAWRPGKGILTLRNPSGKPQTFTFDVRKVLELPEAQSDPMLIEPVYVGSRQLPASPVDVAGPVALELAPFETAVFELLADNTGVP